MSTAWAEFEAEFKQAAAGDRGDVIGRHFDERAVGLRRDLMENTLYCLKRSNGEVQVIRTGPGPFVDWVDFKLATEDRAFKPIWPGKFLELGRQGKITRLVPRRRQDIQAQDEDVSDDPGSLRAVNPHRDQVLDMGAFSQLADAAQRSGLVPDYDLIAHVRDREFRFCDYPKAFQLIEGLYGKFNAAASQRDQKLKSEDVAIRSGRVRMSPKDLQAKRQKDQWETQLVERARGRFMRVLEGLRVLMRLDAED